MELKTLSWLALAPMVLLATPALAQDDDKPPEPVVLKNVPPRFSWDFAVQASYSMLPQFDAAPPWMGIGFRTSWGRHWGSTGNHRFGPSFAASFEGPIAVQWANYFEPAASYDFVGENRFWAGASLGASVIVNVDLQDQASYITTVDFAPMVAARIGYSTQYSVLMKRFFVGVEPKFRLVDGILPSFGGSIVIGTGMGY
jgi:hypothetical protein